MHELYKNTSGVFVRYAHASPNESLEMTSMKKLMIHASRN